MAIVLVNWNKYKMEMNSNVSNIFKKTKKNKMNSKANKHYNSTGQYYSFGDKGAFKSIGDSSVGQYMSKTINFKKNREMLSRANIYITQS